jgi:hypothetical protein
LIVIAAMENLRRWHLAFHSVSASYEFFRRLWSRGALVASARRSVNFLSEVPWIVEIRASKREARMGIS